MSRDALVVGINRYPFWGAKHLTTPAEDAEAIAQRLENYGDFRVQRLPAINQDGKLRVNPTGILKVEELEEAIAQLFNPEGHNRPETALLFFSGHGLRKSENGKKEGFLATSDVSPRKGQWGVSLQWLSRLLQESPVRQQIVWLDCCYSGELLNFDDTGLKEQQLGRDRCFIAASRELAHEDLNGKHGVLTRALLQGLDPNQHQENQWVDNLALANLVNRELKIIPQHPLYNNSGNPINLIRGRSSKDVDEFHRQRACTYYEQKSFKEAVAECQEAIDFNHRDAFAHELKGHCLYKLEEFDEAIFAYEQATALKPWDAKLWVSFGDACRKKDRLIKASASYQTAIQAEPKLAEAYGGWGKVLYSQGKFDKAVDKLTEAIRREMKDPEVHEYLAYALDKQDRQRNLKEVVENLKEAAKLYRNKNMNEKADKIERNLQLGANGNWSKKAKRFLKGFLSWS